MAKVPVLQLEANCRLCGALFKFQKKLLKRGGGKFCSRKCSNRFSCPRRMKNVKKCDNCGEDFRARLRDTGHRFCSARCRKLKLGIVRICKQCKSEFERYDRRQKTEFCSRECYEKDHATEIVTRMCSSCGEVFERRRCFDQRSGVNPNRNRYCSRMCQLSFNRGINNPRYLGNRSADRGPYWANAKKACIERSMGVCKFCDIIVEGFAACVDHVIPYRLFERTDVGMRASCNEKNLWLLCRGCHTRKSHMEMILYREGLNAFMAAVQCLTRNPVTDKIFLAHKLLIEVR